MWVPVSVMDGGTFAPGTNTLASQLNVHGSLTLSSAATYMVTINGSSSSFANVTGAAALNGAGSHCQQQFDRCFVDASV